MWPRMLNLENRNACDMSISLTFVIYHHGNRTANLLYKVLSATFLPIFITNMIVTLL